LQGLFYFAGGLKADRGRRDEVLNQCLLKTNTELQPAQYLKCFRFFGAINTQPLQALSIY